MQNDAVYVLMSMPRRPSTANMILDHPTFAPDYWNRMSATQESWASFNLPRRPSTVGAGCSGFRPGAGAMSQFMYQPPSETNTSLFDQSFLNGGAFGAPPQSQESNPFVRFILLALLGLF